MWKKSLDKYVTIHEVQSSRILPIIIDQPGYQPSVHINIYLPTAGREDEFVEELSVLENVVDDILEKHPNALTYYVAMPMHPLTSVPKTKGNISSTILSEKSIFSLSL